MMLTAAELKSALLDLSLYSDEALAISAWTNAWKRYFRYAAANLVPVNPLAVQAAGPSMQAAMTGLSVTGAASIQAGIVAFWTTLAGSATLAWPGAASITVSPGISGIAAALTPIFYANTAAGLVKDPAMEIIASTIHGLQTGGTVVYPSPTGSYPIV